MIVFTDPKTHLGLIIGVLMASMIAFAIPNFLIGGCGSFSMKCRKAAFPALTAESVVLLVFSAIIIMVTAQGGLSTIWAGLSPLYGRGAYFHSKGAYFYKTQPSPNIQ
jgi:uncharacterized SAM-binding protein YcdF (DUF218 family)